MHICSQRSAHPSLAGACAARQRLSAVSTLATTGPVICRASDQALSIFRSCSPACAPFSQRLKAVEPSSEVPGCPSTNGLLQVCGKPCRSPESEDGLLPFAPESSPPPGPSSRCSSIKAADRDPSRAMRRLFPATSLNRRRCRPLLACSQRCPWKVIVCRSHGQGRQGRLGCRGGRTAAGLGAVSPLPGRQL